MVNSLAVGDQVYQLQEDSKERNSVFWYINRK